MSTTDGFIYLEIGFVFRDTELMFWFLTGPFFFSSESPRKSILLDLFPETVECQLLFIFEGTLSKSTSFLQTALGIASSLTGPCPRFSTCALLTALSWSPVQAARTLVQPQVPIPRHPGPALALRSWLTFLP